MLFVANPYDDIVFAVDSLRIKKKTKTEKEFETFKT